MHRRAFLGALATAAVALTLDPERALWVPGAKTIFLPAPKPTLLTTTALTRGDIFTIAGCYAMNPMTGAPLGVLQHFVITADATVGEVALSTVCPRPIVDGHYQNVTAFSGQNYIQPLMLPWGNA